MTTVALLDVPRRRLPAKAPVPVLKTASALRTMLQYVECQERPIPTVARQPAPETRSSVKENVHARNKSINLLPLLMCLSVNHTSYHCVKNSEVLFLFLL